jgi:predicted GIY-YIG superfamily endonuclease
VKRRRKKKKSRVYYTGRTSEGRMFERWKEHIKYSRRRNQIPFDSEMRVIYTGMSPPEAWKKEKEVKDLSSEDKDYLYKNSWKVRITKKMVVRWRK